MLETVSVIIISMLPISELRGSIPLGIGLGLDPLTVIMLSIIFNTLIFFPIYFGSDFFYGKFLKRFKFVRNTVKRVQKNEKFVEKYGIWSLIIFVAIPLPITGAWTGSVLAWVMGLDWKRSFLCIFIGVLIAAAIVSSVVLGILTFVI